MDKFIRIRGANEHNLKNLDIDIPRDKFVVLTGLSGSGKSSLAFDTIYAEGQRRYMESLSSYARQFLGQMEKPNVESPQQRVLDGAFGVGRFLCLLTCIGETNFYSKDMSVAITCVPNQWINYQLFFAG